MPALKKPVLLLIRYQGILFCREIPYEYSIWSSMPVLFLALESGTLLAELIKKGNKPLWMFNGCC